MVKIFHSILRLLNPVLLHFWHLKGWISCDNYWCNQSWKVMMILCIYIQTYKDIKCVRWRRVFKTSIFYIHYIVLLLMMSILDMWVSDSVDSWTVKVWNLGKYINTLRPRQNGRLFFCIPIKISLKFVPKGPLNNIPSLVQIMAWRRPGAKPLSEPMMVSLTTHIYITRPQWVNDGWI